MRIHTMIVALLMALVFAAPVQAAQGKGPGQEEQPGGAIVPGVSIGPIQLGMTSAQMYAMSGPPSGSRPYDQLKKEFSELGTPVDQYNLFVNGFDTGDDFCTQGAPLSFGQVFYRNDKIVHIIISSWCSEGDMANVRTAEGIGFGSTSQEVLAAFGKPEHEYMDDSVGLVYDYLKRGITIILANDRVDLIEVYSPE